ncbi:hypothetical protein ACTFIR_001575 [Dictyostelium discoideum]
MENLKLLKTYKIDRKKINDRSFGIDNKKVIEELIEVTSTENGFIPEVMQFLSKQNKIPIKYLENRMVCETAHAMNSQEKYDDATRYFLKAASQGSAEGCFFLASMKYLGQGCDVNLSMARKLFERGANMEAYIECEDEFLLENKNVLDCCKCLSGFAQEGVGGEIELETAFKYYSKVLKTKENDLDAIHNIGILQCDLKKDLQEGLKLFKRGMQLGSVECTFSYGAYTFDSNPTDAFKYIQRAANDGNEEAIFKLDEYKSKLNLLKK